MVESNEEHKGETPQPQDMQETSEADETSLFIDMLSKRHDRTTKLVKERVDALIALKEQASLFALTFAKVQALE